MKKLIELKNLGERHPEMRKSAGWLNEHANNLINVRMNLIICEDFTKEEFDNIKEYLNYIENEDYELLDQFRIVEI